MKPPLILPHWPAPSWVKAVSTTRQGGISLPPWDSLNLGDHVGDDHAAVAQNRKTLAALIGRSLGSIHWLDQVHGNRVVDIPNLLDELRADATTTTSTGEVCAILTADCLPVLFCDRAGTRVAAAHAGWRGLAEGVLEQVVARFDQPASVLAWLGPAIGPGSFEVGPEVRQLFLTQDPDAAACFEVSPQTQERFLADIYELARRRLRHSGVTDIFGGQFCTVREAGRFYSFRREGLTGRQATLIWMDA